MALIDIQGITLVTLAFGGPPLLEDVRLRLDHGDLDISSQVAEHWVWRRHDTLAPP